MSKTSAITLRQENALSTESESERAQWREPLPGTERVSQEQVAWFEVVLRGEHCEFLRTAADQIRKARPPEWLACFLAQVIPPYARHALGLCVGEHSISWKVDESTREMGHHFFHAINGMADAVYQQIASWVVPRLYARMAIEIRNQTGPLGHLIASGITSKPAIEDHFKTGQRTITLDD